MMSKSDLIHIYEPRCKNGTNFRNSTFGGKHTTFFMWAKKKCQVKAGRMWLVLTRQQVVKIEFPSY